MLPDDHDLSQDLEGIKLSAEDVQAQIGRLRDSEGRVRIAAAYALGKSGEGEGVQPLITALKDRDLNVRRAAAWALGRLRDVQAVMPLYWAFQRNERDVRCAMALALWGIGDAATLPLRVLAATTLTPAQKLETLKALTDFSARMGGDQTLKIRYRLGDVQTFCAKLCSLDSTEGSVWEGAQAVLAELRKLSDPAVLLRASAREEPWERQELLRGALGHSEATAPEELLRPVEDAFLPSFPSKQGNATEPPEKQETHDGR